MSFASADKEPRTSSYTNRFQLLHEEDVMT